MHRPGWTVVFSFFYVRTNRYEARKEASAILTHDPHSGSEGRLTPSELKNLIEQSLDADKAEDIVSIKLDEQTGLADYMIIASGTSSRHVSALTDKILKRLALNGIKSVGVEGKDRSDWVAIDAGDVIIHLFRPEVRSFYNIEKMWGNFQPFEVVSDPLHA
ncbi:MAG: ribosome silencing factor [Rhodospirillales bacterium]|nr:ribosome silencing factor [Rhodospirillales bacterium]